MRCKPMETMYETYIRTICSNCKNRTTDLCNIKRNIKGNLRCCYYVKDKETEGYKKQLKVTAKQSKPLMKNILK